MSGRFHPNHESRPRLLLAYADPTYASECGRFFRRLGWEVQLVASGAEALMLANEYRPNVVAVDADLLSENGWFNDHPVREENPNMHIVLVDDDVNANATNNDRLRKIGAEGSVRRADGAEGLAHTILDHRWLAEAV